MEFGHASLSEREIVAFARDYDPRSIRTDPAWSATGPFGGLIASGLHTIAACMRLYVDHYISQVASLASPGLDEIRWPRMGLPRGPSCRVGCAGDTPQPESLEGVRWQRARGAW